MSTKHSKAVAKSTTPLQAVFLRLLSWEIGVAGRDPIVQELVEKEIEAARRELGITTPYSLGSGGPHRFLADSRRKKLLSAAHEAPAPLERHWIDHRGIWRVWYTPHHDSVRRLSDRPVVAVDSGASIDITLRNPAAPKLQLVVSGAEKPTATLDGCRGMYFLRYCDRGSDNLYIGQTDEFPTRYQTHLRTKTSRPIWWVFISPIDGLDGRLLPTGAVDAAEGMLISFWSEVCRTRNTQAGRDTKPTETELQLGVLFAQAAAAGLLWLVRERASIADGLGIARAQWNLPFYDWPGQKGWPDIYLKPPQD